MRSTILGLSLLSALPFAAAHGFLKSITIDGTAYKGNVPNGDASDSAIRLIDKVEPVKGAMNNAMNCGQDAKKATLVADANPGSKLEFAWAGGDGSNWPHNTGPMMTYLASCGNTTCDQYNSADAQWFKIDEAGKKSDGTTWIQQDLMNGKTYSTTLPDNLAGGEYLVRHEIIALHLATEKGGAEFYPSCSQIKVGGNGTGTPSSSDLVSFPGAYSDTDAGILVNAYDDTPYDFPGPKIADLSGGSNNSSSSSGSASGSGASSTQTASEPDTVTSAASATATKFLSDAGSSRTRAIVDGTTSAADGSSTASAVESTSTNTRAHKHKHCGDNSATATVSSSLSAVSSSAESVITSFAVTSTITLDAIPTDATSFSSVASNNALDVRPRRVSRVMRILLEHV